MSSERYVLGPSIAEGGMGAVHLARVRGVADFSRVVAIKRMHARLAEEQEFKTMFLDEARMSARIRHANVVQTLDALEVDEEIWIVMEYVAGASLARLTEKGPAPPAVALAIFEGVLAGLDAAHRATAPDGTPLGLVHRDISPQNVLIGVDGVARIVDFGIAKARNRENVSLTGQFKGKVAYAAPECLHGGAATVASDIWSTGVTLWEALVGKPLFSGENHPQLLFNIMEGKPKPISIANPPVGDAFDAVVLRALSRDPEARFPSAREMLTALEGTGRPASPREVAAWVEATAKTELEQRAALVQSVEANMTAASGVLAAAPEVVQVRTAPTQLASPTIATHTLPLAPPPFVPPPQQRTPMPAHMPAAAKKSSGGIGFGVALIGGGAALAIAIAFGLSLDRTDPPTAKPTPTTPPSSAPEIVPPPPASTAVVVAEPEPTTSASVTKPKVRPPKPPGTTTAAKPACDPPYTVDANGDKHYKPECFR